MIAMQLPSSLQNLNTDALQRFREICKVPVNFESSKEKDACQKVVEGLSEEELQATANISYAYWALKTLGDDVASPEVAKQVAMKVARWHVQFEGGNGEKALHHLREALEVRKEHKLDLFRTCFDTEGTSDDHKSMSDDVRSDAEKQLQVLWGQDKVGRAVVLKLPRIHGGTTESAYVRHNMYAAERGAAVTEFVSVGQQDTIVAIFNMQNQNSSYAPPLSWQLRVIKLLQVVFPGRMGIVLVLEAPFLIRQIFNAIKPFLSASLRDSVYMVAGKSKGELMEKTLVDPHILKSDGTLVNPVDLEEYFTKVPFYCPCDYKM